MPFKRKPKKKSGSVSRTLGDDVELAAGLNRKTIELKNAERAYQEIEASNKILSKEQVEMSAEISRLNRKLKKDAKEFEKYRIEAERREEARQGRLFSRIVGAPLRIINSILSKEIRDRETKINNQRKNLNSLENKLSKLERDLANQREDSKKYREISRAWKRRFDVLSRDNREERGLETDPLIQNLRGSLARRESEIDELEEKIRTISTEIQKTPPSVESVTEALRMAEEDFENMVILETGWRSAKKSVYRDPLLVYNTLKTMAKEAVLWQSEQEGSESFENRIRHLLDIANHDSTDRYWNTGGIFERMNKHVKLGVDHDPKNTLRIYYGITRNDGIRVAYCGEHP
jgi:DNA repair exonuclease SbcCD ATPase subunit